METSDFGLPPGVDGEVQSVLTLGVGELLLRSDQKVDFAVEPIWWGLDGRNVFLRCGEENPFNFFHSLFYYPFRGPADCVVCKAVLFDLLFIHLEDI